LIVRKRQSARASVHYAAGAALLLALVAPGCSELELPKEELPKGEMPVSGTDQSYSRLVANHLKSEFKNRVSYDTFEISGARWVDSLKGWNWLTCVRFQDRGHRRIYALFIKDGVVVDARYAVQTDACEAQSYSPFDVMPGGMKPGGGMEEPLY
jgi:hypothetical protein